MALGVQPKVSHDISFAVGKGLQGLKVEAMAKDAPRKAARGWTLLESVMLGALTVAVAAIPVVVTHVPAPESLVVIKEVLQEWCTPSICFGVLIIGVLVVTLGGAGAEAPATPEESHQKFADSYLPQLGPVAASQIDPLRMPDIFFSPDAARLTHSASFPAHGPQTASSVMVPVYYPAFVDHPPFPSHSEKEVEFSHGRERFVSRFTPRVGDRFSPRIDDRFSPRVDDRFSPRVDDRFSSRVEEWFSPKPENRFGPRVEERFSPRVEDRFGPKMDDRYVPERYASPQVEERYVPQVEERYEPQVEERYVPQVEERYIPQVEERYIPQVEERYIPQVEERYIPQVEERYIPQVEERYIPQVEERYIPQVEERYIPQVEERYEPLEHDRFEEEDAYEPEEEASGARIESRAHSEHEHRYAHAESDRENEVEFIESEADDEGEPEPEVQTDSEPEPEEPPLVPVAPETLPSPPHSPIAPELSTPAAAPSSLLSRRKPPAVPTPVIVQTAPPPPPPPPEVLSLPEPKVVSTPEPKVASPPQPEMSMREAPEMSPSTPPKHSSERRSSSRSYGEFVRSTIDCPLPTLKTPSKALPKVASSPSPAAETLDEKLARMKSRRFSTGGISLPPAPNKRPREVRVVDDDTIDKELDVDPGQEDDDVDQRVEAFLRNFREQMRLQRQESLHRHRRGSDLAKP